MEPAGRSVQSATDSSQSAYRLIGQTLGHFVVRELLGQGGMGAVYKAYDPTLDRNVALKMIIDKHQYNQKMQSLKKEAHILAGLQHPNIGTIHLLMEDKGCVFFVMDHYRGNTLDHFISQKTFSPPVFEVAVLVDYMLQILNGLHYAHQKKVIHKDLKPANIMLDEQGLIHILDFGLATFMYHASGSGNYIAGTPAYMSPEQSRAEALDHRSDLYSAGVIMYELVTGQKPFQGKTFPVVLKQIQAGKPKKPRALWPRCPKALEKIIMKMMATNPNVRYQNASEVIEDLANINILSSSFISASVSASGYRKFLPVTKNSQARSGKHFIVPGLVIVVIFAFVAMYASQYQKQDNHMKTMEIKYQQAVNLIHLGRPDLASLILQDIVAQEGQSATGRKAQGMLEKVQSTK